ncbi:MAG: hypothetical protein ACR2QM_04215 [Longimicrobiales bacterium]
MKNILLMAVAIVIAAGVPTPVEAQDQPVVALADTADLVFEREVFQYPSYVRRNPFVPLVNDAAGGPAFDELQLLGVVHHRNPLYSVALFAVGDVANAGVGANSAGGGGGSLFETHRLRRGDIIGNTRIVDISVDRVVVEVEEFGMAERHTLELPRAEQGGPS